MLSDPSEYQLYASIQPWSLYYCPPFLPPQTPHTCFSVIVTHKLSGLIKKKPIILHTSTASVRECHCPVMTQSFPPHTNILNFMVKQSFVQSKWRNIFAWQLSTVNADTVTAEVTVKISWTILISHQYFITLYRYCIFLFRHSCVWSITSWWWYGLVHWCFSWMMANGVKCVMMDLTR